MRPDEVSSRQELATFLEDLHEKLVKGPIVANHELPAFISGAAGWTSDLEGYFRDRGEPVPTEPTWSLVASIFEAATVYE